MKNFKLILRSLVNNNACIDGGRYKKWYFAVIMFFLSIILAIVPTFVKTIKTNGDDVFANVSYATQEATYDFSKHIAENDTLKMYVKYNESNDSKTLVVDGWTEDYQCKNAKDETVFIFYYTPTINDDYLKIAKNKEFFSKLKMKASIQS